MIAAALVLVATLAACGDDDGAPADGGPDTSPAADCAIYPTAEGCPCTLGARAECYAAPPETERVGECLPGRTLCESGRWSACDGQVLPRAEVCDGDDDDCDGLVDDGARSPCGGCDPSCAGGVWGEADDPFSEDDGTAIAVTGEGLLTLARDVAGTATVWVANSADDTVSRIDAASATETARYASLGDEPSRIAVDYHGDAWIANRELEGGTPSLIRIAADLARCADRDGDGIETSAGPTDVRLAGEDECVMLRADVGAPGSVARALAIDGSRGLDGASGGNPWVGLHETMEVVALDAFTGAEIARVPTPGFSPYAAAFDAWGTLWLLDRDGLIARIDRAATPLAAQILEVPFACFLLYSLAVDDDGRLVLTGFSCDGAVVYDPRSGRWAQEPTPASPRGVVWRAPYAWVAHSGSQVSRLTVSAAPSLEVAETFELAGLGVTPIESIGIATDVLDQVWVISSTGGNGDNGVATRLEAATGEVTAQVTVGMAPHTQGDLTGGELRGGFVPEGEATHVFRGCAEGPTVWRAVHLAAYEGAFGEVDVAVRHAETEAGLADTPFVDLATFPTSRSPWPLDVPDGGVLETRLRLRTPHRDGAPRIARVGIEWDCPGPM